MLSANSAVVRMLESDLAKGFFFKVFVFSPCHGRRQKRRLAAAAAAAQVEMQETTRCSSTAFTTHVNARYRGWGAVVF
jgi:hypothetical protein